MLKSRLLGASALFGTLVMGLPAYAQVVDPATADSEVQEADDGNEVVVTGSRLSRPNDESPVPVASLSGETFFETGKGNIGETLNDLPQLRNTFSQQNIGANVGVAGLNLLDLRGLGTSRTLVLVNGRRHVGSDALVTTLATDVNSIPADLIERVDIVTGGSSAVYGSDAVAGVVNFILRRSYDGVQVRGNAGIAEKGFGANQFVSVLAGQNFAGGRGNVALSGEYFRQERIFASDIPWYRQVNGFLVVDVDPAIAGGNSDGFGDRAFFRDVRSAGNNRFGLVPISQLAASPACGTGIGSTNGAPSTTGGNAYNCNFIFTDQGRLQAQTGTRVGTGPIGSFIGGNGQTGREGIIQSIYGSQERYNANLLAHYEFSPEFELFAEAKYSRVKSAGVNVASEFITGQYTQFDYRERIRLDNPYLNPADRTAIANAILASGCNTTSTGSPTVCTATNRSARADGGVIGGGLNAADRAAIAAGTYRFALAKQFLDAGLRDQIATRETYRAVAGLRGTVGSSWKYELAANYGEFRERVRNTGFFDKQRFQLSIDAGLDPATNTIRCRSQFDPAARIGRNNAFDQARLAADIAACVPYNPFGDSANPAQNNNAAAAQYFTVNSSDNAKITQLNFIGFMSGDSSSVFELPGGPIRFSLGAEYRRDKAFYDQDDFTENLASYTTFLSGLGFSAPATTVYESYGEVQLPLLADLPFVKELSINGAGRISKYNTVGRIYTYNYGGTYAPIEDVRFRVNYGRSVRAPNVSETNTPITPNFFNSFSDPCRRDAIGTGSQFRAANCRTALGATLDNAAFAGQPAYNLKVLSGSNPNLEPEKSDSWTIGGVVTPRFIPNLTISVDYYNIKVKGVITSVTAQTIANSCYDLPTLDNPFCPLIFRNLSGATGPDSELPGQILSNTLLQSPLNFAKLARRGIDTQVNYRTNFSENVGLNINAIYTHVLQNSSFVNPADPTFENVALREIGNPADEFRVDTDVRVGAVTFGYRARFIGRMYLNTFEDYNSVGGRAPENADYADIRKYPIITYHDVRLEWNLDGLGGGLGKGFQFYVGADNVLGQKPPLGLTATAGGGAIYDVRGRYYYSGFRARF